MKIEVESDNVRLTSTNVREAVELYQYFTIKNTAEESMALAAKAQAKESKRRRKQTVKICDMCGKEVRGLKNHIRLAHLTPRRF